MIRPPHTNVSASELAVETFRADLRARRRPDLPPVLRLRGLALRVRVPAGVSTVRASCSSTPGSPFVQANPPTSADAKRSPAAGPVGEPVAGRLGAIGGGRSTELLAVRKPIPLRNEKGARTCSLSSDGHLGAADVGLGLRGREGRPPALPRRAVARLAAGQVPALDVPCDCSKLTKGTPACT